MDAPDSSGEFVERLRLELPRLLARRRWRWGGQIIALLGDYVTTGQETAAILAELRQMREDFDGRMDEQGRCIEEQGWQLEEHSCCIQEHSRRIEELARTLGGDRSPLGGMMHFGAVCARCLRIKRRFAWTLAPPRRGRQGTGLPCRCGHGRGGLRRHGGLDRDPVFTFRS